MCVCVWFLFHVAFFHVRRQVESRDSISCRKSEKAQTIATRMFPQKQQQFHQSGYTLLMAFLEPNKAEPLVPPVVPGTS